MENWRKNIINVSVKAKQHKKERLTHRAAKLNLKQTRINSVQEKTKIMEQNEQCDPING